MRGGDPASGYVQREAETGKVRILQGEGLPAKGKWLLVFDLDSVQQVWQPAAQLGELWRTHSGNKIDQGLSDGGDCSREQD